MYEDSKNFYKKQRHKTFKRSIKKTFPLIIAAVAVWLIIAIIFFFIPLFLLNANIQSILTHSILAAFIGSGVVLLEHLRVIYCQSQFQPIKIRVQPKLPPFDH